MSEIEKIKKDQQLTKLATKIYNSAKKEGVTFNELKIVLSKVRREAANAKI